LHDLKVLLERDRDGKLNVDRASASGGALPEVGVDKILVSRATVIYTDQLSATTMEARDCKIHLEHLALRPGRREEWLKKLSFAAELSCGELRTKDFTASSVTATVHETAAVVNADPFSLRLFDGRGSGAIRADYSNSVPAYRVRYHLAAFHLDELFKALSPQALGQGYMDFDAELASHGDTMAELKQSVGGHATLRGGQLTLQIGDLDKRLARFESTQNFDLVDAGAFFFAGPIGLGITKGYDFARVFQDTAGSTSIRELVSEWRIEQGVAHASDVALATPRNRVALKGDLLLARGELSQVTVALVDAQGCSKAEQNVHGSFLHPQVDIPTFIKALAGPTRRLLGKAQSLLGKKCQPFYLGSVAASQ
jgi:AsmA protein